MSSPSLGVRVPTGFARGAERDARGTCEGSLRGFVEALHEGVRLRDALREVPRVRLLPGSGGASSSLTVSRPTPRKQRGSGLRMGPEIMMQAQGAAGVLRGGGDPHQVRGDEGDPSPVRRQDGHQRPLVPDGVEEAKGHGRGAVQPDGVLQGRAHEYLGPRNVGRRGAQEDVSPGPASPESRGLSGCCAAAHHQAHLQEDLGSDEVEVSPESGLAAAHEVLPRLELIRHLWHSTGSEGGPGMGRTVSLLWQRAAAG